MSKQKTHAELSAHKTTSIKKVDEYLGKLINSSDLKAQSKGDKLCYWLEDYTKFLDYEPAFDPSNLRRYKRGEILKVHLGYNIGSEEGGLHYAVVLDKKNPLTSPVITIVPLTSVKPKSDLKHLRKGSVYLGNEIFVNLSANISLLNGTLKSEIANLTAALNESTYNPESLVEKDKAIETRIIKAKEEMSLLERMLREASNMKKGSIALVNQITTISKIRIYDPKTNKDVLSNIKLSNEKLDLLDLEFISNYTNRK